MGRNRVEATSVIFEPPVDTPREPALALSELHGFPCSHGLSTWVRSLLMLFAGCYGCFEHVVRTLDAEQAVSYCGGSIPIPWRGRALPRPSLKSSALEVDQNGPTGPAE